MLRTSKLTKALDWSGWLWACFAWYSEEDRVDCPNREKGKVGLTVPDQVGDELDRLQAVCLLRVGEALLLQSLCVFSWTKKLAGR